MDKFETADPPALPKPGPEERNFSQSPVSYEKLLHRGLNQTIQRRPTWDVRLAQHKAIGCLGGIRVKHLVSTDPAIYRLIQAEGRRQQAEIELIASENFTSPAVMEAMGTWLTNKYAEGYPGARYYGGCQVVDQVEDLARERARQLFGAEYANVQPHSGAQANMAVYFSLLKPGDKVMGLDLTHGGHLTHGSPVNFSGVFYRFVGYGVDRDTETLNYDALAEQARQERPTLIVAGASAYPRTWDFARLRAIADEVGAYLMVDMAHFAGLVAAGLHPNPVPHAHFTTTTTHKTLRGPRGGMILSSAEWGKKLDKAVFPLVQGGPLMHVIAAKAVCFHEALQPEFRGYQRQVLANAQTLARTLVEAGLDLVSGGTDNHLMLVKVSSLNLTGKEAEAVLGQVGITVNKNTIPFDPRKPNVSSGVRLGTPAMTTRGFREAELEIVGRCIYRALAGKDSPAELAQVRRQVHELCDAFPLYDNVIAGVAD